MPSGWPLRPRAGGMRMGSQFMCFFLKIICEYILKWKTQWFTLPRFWYSFVSREFVGNMKHCTGRRYDELHNIIFGISQNHEFFCGDLLRNFEFFKTIIRFKRMMVKYWPAKSVPPKLASVDSLLMHGLPSKNIACILARCVSWKNVPRFFETDLTESPFKKNA